MQINQNYLVNVSNKQSEEQLNSTCLHKTMFIALKRSLHSFFFFFLSPPKKLALDHYVRCYVHH